MVDRLSGLDPRIIDAAVRFTRTVIPDDTRRVLSDFLYHRPRLPLPEPYCLRVDDVAGRFTVDSYWDWETLSDTGQYNERPFLEVFVKSLRRDGVGVAWDVGAAQGMYAIMGAQLGMSVIAFEPYSIYQASLDKNRRLNGLEEKIRIVPFALSDQNITANLYYGKASPSLINVGDCSYSALVELKTADGLISDGFPAPTFVKIDAEGSEETILQGARGLFTSEQRPRHVFIEIHPDLLRANGTSRDAVTALLCSWNYVDIEGDMLVRGTTTLHHFVHDGRVYV